MTLKNKYNRIKPQIKRKLKKERSDKKMQGIGIGISDFKMLRLRDNYYIDKTMYIKDIIDNQSGVVLITRPRRFGKTLNMSMLKYYFDINQKDSKELFQGLKIMEQEEKYTSKLGANPVIYVTLKDAGLQNYEYMIMQMKTIIRLPPK